MDRYRIGDNPAKPGQRRGALIGPTLVLATLVSSIISSFGAPLIPSIARDFDASLASAQWSLTVALVVGTVSSPVLGRLGDGPRRRATLLVGLAVVTVGGIISALAGGLGLLLVGRGLQGVGLGLAPLAMAIARQELPRAKVPSMIALLSVSSAAGLGAGYPASGLIAGAWGIQGAYWFGAVVSALALLCVGLVVPSAREQSAPARLDWLGAVLLAPALVALLVAVSEGAQWGWGSLSIVGLMVVGAVFFAAWIGQQQRARDPLVQLRLLRHPSARVGDVCALVLGAAMYMVLTGVTEFVQSPRSGGFGFSASAVVSGLVLIPLSVLMVTSSRLLPVLLERMGIRVVLSAGCFVAAAGCTFFAVFHDGLWQAFVMTGVLGIGLGITFAAIPGLIAQSVPAQETGSAIGFYQVLRFAGFSLGSALTASVLAAHLGGDDQPTVDGYSSVLWIATGLCVVAALIPWLLHGRKPQPTTEKHLPDDEIRMLEETEGDELSE